MKHFLLEYFILCKSERISRRHMVMVTLKSCMSKEQSMTHFRYLVEGENARGKGISEALH